MLGKNQIKLITGLRQKKFREQAGLFFSEGPKVTTELLSAGFELEKLYCVEGFHLAGSPDAIVISGPDLKKISALTTPNQCLALFRIPKNRNLPASPLTVALDDVRDPGNLGTIIRLCDWFGVTKLVCSTESADVFNPKVVQATMGSLARVEVVYTKLESFVKSFDGDVAGTFMDGENLYSADIAKKALIVLGNESNGISPQVEKLCSKRIAVPRFGALQKAESLNVATAASIVLSEMARRTI